MYEVGEGDEGRDYGPSNPPTAKEALPRRATLPGPSSNQAHAAGKGPLTIAS
jgi:hypothetical protein